jgi:hypothetical protein
MGVEIPGKKDKSDPVQTELRPVNWGLDQKSYGKVLDEVNRDMKAVCDLKIIGEELDRNVEAKKEARKEELLEDIEWCLMDQEAEKKDDKKRDEKKQGDISSQKLQAATAAKEVDSHSQSMVSEEQRVPLIKTTQSHLIYNTRGHQHDREEASGKVGSDNSSKKEKDKSTIDKTKTENKLS